jgi:hypothetical protein
MNPDQQIALASVIAGGAVGLAGILVAGVGGWRDRALSRNLAETARKQQRLAEAYVELIELAEKIGYWASRLRPVVTVDLDYQPPEPPSLDEQTRVCAKVLAYGSKDVKAKWKSWQECVKEIEPLSVKRCMAMGRPMTPRPTTPTSRAAESSRSSRRTVM